MNLNELPEQPLTPPELPLGLQIVCESIRSETEAAQKTVLERRAKEVLRTRMGTVRTVSRDGRYIELDAGDLYDDITAGEESADLSILLSACLGDADPDIQLRATSYLDMLIQRFADEYSAYAADKAVEVYLVGLGEAA